jgi:hypothetical protein
VLQEVEIGLPCADLNAMTSDLALLMAIRSGDQARTNLRAERL